MSFSFGNPYLVVILETLPVNLLFPIEITLYPWHGSLLTTHLPSSSSVNRSFCSVHLAGILLQIFSSDWCAGGVYSEFLNLCKYFPFTLIGKLYHGWG